jgi:hypothetical protein
MPPSDSLRERSSNTPTNGILPTRLTSASTKYDDLIADYSAVAVTADTEAIKAFRTRLDDVDAEALSLEAQLDLERTKQTLDGMLLRNDVIRRWAKDPDLYSSGITNDAFVMISRTFAPPEQRLRAGSPGRDDSTGQYLTRASSIEASVGFDHDTVQRALRALNTQPSFFEKVTEVSGGEIVMVGPPTGSALRVAGAWPSPENLLERLIAALENAADDEMRAPDERSKLKQAATWLASFGSQIAISALGGAAGNVLSS